MPLTFQVAIFIARTVAPLGHLTARVKIIIDLYRNSSLESDSPLPSLLQANQSGADSHPESGGLRFQHGVGALNRPVPLTDERESQAVSNLRRGGFAAHPAHPCLGDRGSGRGAR